MAANLPPAPIAPTPEQTPATLFDRSNPRSVVNLLPERVRTLVEEAYFLKPELFIEDEKDLFRKLTQDNKQPTPTDHRLRMKFWNEYDYAQAYGKASIEMNRVVAGVCTVEYFYNKYMTSPSKVAWLLCPPTQYMVKAEEALSFGIDQLRDILDQPHINGGKIDMKLAELKLKIVALLEPRVQGAVAQKVLHAHAHIKGAAAQKAVEGVTAVTSMAKIDERLKSLREAKEKMQNGGAILVEAETVE